MKSYKSSKLIINEPEKLIDELVSRVEQAIGRAHPVKAIRKSQILTALLGLIGFSLFTLGISKIFQNFSGDILLLAGFLLMVVSGLLLQNLLR